MEWLHKLTLLQISNKREMTPWPPFSPMNPESLGRLEPRQAKTSAKSIRSPEFWAFAVGDSCTPWRARLPPCSTVHFRPNTYDLLTKGQLRVIVDLSTSRVHEWGRPSPGSRRREHAQPKCRKTRPAEF